MLTAELSPMEEDQADEIIEFCILGKSLDDRRRFILKKISEVDADGFKRGYAAASHDVEDSLRTHGLAKTLRRIREKPDAE